MTMKKIPEDSGKGGGSAPRPDSRRKDNRAAISRALKNAYKSTVEEDIPADLKDLISKLD